MPATTGPTSELGHPAVAPWSAFVVDDEQVPQLSWPSSIRTYHKMRTDAQVDALTKSITLPLRRLSWMIDPNGARDEVVEQVAADMSLPIRGAEPTPRGRRRFSHDDMLRHAILALWYGHMFFEQVGVIDDDEAWRLRKIAPRMPQSITEIMVAKDGGLDGIKQHDPKAYRGKKIPINRLVAFVWEREGANWTGRSMLRPLYRHWLLKDRLLRIDAIKNERFGVGIPTGTAPAGGDPAEYARMAQAIRAGENSGAGLPEGANIGVEGIRGALPDTMGSVNYHDEAMARSFMAMIVQLGQTKTGSRALGETFADFFQMAIDAIADWYASVVSEHVIEDMVDWNWGEDEPTPLLVWEKPDTSELAVSDLIALITNEVIKIDADLEQWVRDRHNLPPLGDEVAADLGSTIDDDEPLEDWARESAGLLPLGGGDVDEDAGPVPVAAHLPGKHNQKDHGSNTANVQFVSQEEWDVARVQADEKIKNAPTPTAKDVAKAREDLRTSKRAGGDSRGGSSRDRRRQRENLFNEFGGAEKGYVVDHGTGLKLHWTRDPAINTEGYPVMERGKIFVKAQGGAYRLSNLLPESFATNRSRNNEQVRQLPDEIERSADAA